MNEYRLNQYRPRTDEARANTDEVLRSMRTADLRRVERNDYDTAISPSMWKRHAHERSGNKISTAIAWGTAVLLGVALWIGIVVYP